MIQCGNKSHAYEHHIVACRPYRLAENAVARRLGARNRCHGTTRRSTATRIARERTPSVGPHTQCVRARAPAMPATAVGASHIWPAARTTHSSQDHGPDLVRHRRASPRTGSGSSSGSGASMATQVRQFALVKKRNPGHDPSRRARGLNTGAPTAANGRPMTNGSPSAVGPAQV